MNLKLMIAIGAAVGTVVWAVQRQLGGPTVEPDPWAHVTDTVAPAP